MGKGMEGVPCKTLNSPQHTYMIVFQGRGCQEDGEKRKAEEGDS